MTKKFTAKEVLQHDHYDRRDCTFRAHMVLISLCTILLMSQVVPTSEHDVNISMQTFVEVRDVFP